MNSALIGYTGFVGSNLAKQINFSNEYNSKNIQEIEGKHFDLVVCAGVQAKKWLANKEPDWDWAGIEALMKALSKVKAETFVLISTIDVYPSPINVDENSVIDVSNTHAYGKHRFQFEEWIKQQFPKVHILRLPALFGEGLKKNVIYDFINDNNTQAIHQEGIFQFYNLDYIGRDVQRAIDNNIGLLNISSEPVSVKEILTAAFPEKEWSNNLPLPAPFYDYHTIYAKDWGNEGKYLYTKAQVLADIKNFVLKTPPSPAE